MSTTLDIKMAELVRIKTDGTVRSVRLDTTDYSTLKTAGFVISVGALCGVAAFHLKSPPLLFAAIILGLVGCMFVLFFLDTVSPSDLDVTFCGDITDRDDIIRVNGVDHTITSLTANTQLTTRRIIKLLNAMGDEVQADLRYVDKAVKMHHRMYSLNSDGSGGLSLPAPNKEDD